MKSKPLTVEKVKWLVVVRSYRGTPYSFPFSTKKEALEFADNSNFGKRIVKLYKTTNTLEKVWK